VGSPPAALLNYSRAGLAIAPGFLDARDHGWIRLLVAEYERCAGAPQRVLRERLRGPLPFSCPPRKRRLVEHVLSRFWKSAVVAALPPIEARALVFGRAARQQASLGPTSATSLLAELARERGLSAAALATALFADLPDQRVTQAPGDLPSVNELELRANLALVQSLLLRSTHVSIDLEGNARAVVRHAKWRGLICTLDVGSSRERPRLGLSGPLSLFHRTVLYGRHLGELVPRAAFGPRPRAPRSTMGRHP